MADCVAWTFHDDLPMRVEADALRALPADARAFLRDELRFRWAELNGFGWTDVTLMRAAGGDGCVRVCAFGAPARDLWFVWAYVPARSRYELYAAPYDERPAPRWGPLRTAGSLADLLLRLRHETAARLEGLWVAASATRGLEYRVLLRDGRRLAVVSAGAAAARAARSRYFAERPRAGWGGETRLDPDLVDDVELTAAEAALLSSALRANEDAVEHGWWDVVVKP